MNRHQHKVIGDFLTWLQNQDFELHTAAEPDDRQFRIALAAATAEAQARATVQVQRERKGTRFSESAGDLAERLIRIRLEERGFSA